VDSILPLFPGREGYQGRYGYHNVGSSSRLPAYLKQKAPIVHGTRMHVFQNLNKDSILNKDFFKIKILRRRRMFSKLP
jgi:hypothetical protein